MSCKYCVLFLHGQWYIGGIQLLCAYEMFVYFSLCVCVCVFLCKEFVANLVKLARSVNNKHNHYYYCYYISFSEHKSCDSREYLSVNFLLHSIS